MSEDGQFGTASMVRFERILPGPIERVWEFVTTPERLPLWFGQGTIEPRAGGSVILMGGHIRGIVTQWQPPRRLTYTWNVFSPGENESLPAPSNDFRQVVGMFDAANGSTRDQLHFYAGGRHDPVGPLGAKQYLLDMDRFCGFAYFSLIRELVDKNR